MKFTVTVYSRYMQQVNIEANTPEEARVAVARGDGEPLNDPTYLQDEPYDQWNVVEKKGE